MAKKKEKKEKKAGKRMSKKQLAASENKEKDKNLSK